MSPRALLIAASLLSLTACGRAQDSDTAAQAPAAPASAPASAPTPPASAPATPPADDPNAPYTPPAPGEPGGLPKDAAPIPDGGKIDPKSAQGAAAVVQSYYADLEARNYAAAWKLWGGEGQSSNQTLDDFTKSFDAYAQYHANIGAPGEMEGAAGSSYDDVPVQLYGRTKDGKPFNQLGTVTLRRVNDVPGSTAAQRRWHIEKIEVKAAP